MPLRHLQVIRRVQVPILYEYPAQTGFVRLKPGVAFNLRRYQALVQQFARAGWLDHVRTNSRNAPMLGQLDDLESFMFGSKRANLAVVAPILVHIQSGRCFYCQEKSRGAVEVDHFIPWSRYPRDTAHNFVVAHPKCNNDKREMLAAKTHLEHWLDQIGRHGDEIGGQLSLKGFVSDPRCSKLIAKWAYQQAVAINGQAWLGIDNVVPLGQECLELFYGA
ncbi:MAG: HNH endonuclease [Betaproteobacteria bacterium]|nr:HNH endonuclease [Betaproteobacteria bacterium]